MESATTPPVSSLDGHVALRPTHEHMVPLDGAVSLICSNAPYL